MENMHLVRIDAQQDNPDPQYVAPCFLLTHISIFPMLGPLKASSYKLVRKI
jgi:hypothetical protein